VSRSVPILLACFVGAPLALFGCDPYAAWPDAETVFPWVFTPETDLEEYEQVRWETETWDPSEDYGQAGRYLLKLQDHRPGAPDESLEHFEAMRPQTPPLADGPTISFVGDVMWLGENWDAFALPVAGLLDGELRIGNLETPTSPDHPTEQEDLDLYTFNAPVELLDGLPLDLLQLNNNHSVDVGQEGLEATIEQVEARGLLQTGVDQHAIVDVGGRSVALLSYTWGLNGKQAPPDHELFVVPFGHLDEAIDLAPIGADVQGAKAAGADTIVLLLHWGYEYEYYPDPHFLVLGRELVALGADVVVGHGPHVAQPAELCHVNQPEHVPGVGVCSLRTDDGEPRDALILYSLGNFDTMQPTVPIQTGLVATVSLGADGADGAGVAWEAITTTSVGGDLTVLPLAEVAGTSGEHAAEMERLDRHLGTTWKRIR
jgi:poly-gamma-glutamate capsule biosynthesis protein CapA/YwtB (metallophosphatase superfamily)